MHHTRAATASELLCRSRIRQWWDRLRIKKRIRTRHSAEIWVRCNQARLATDWARFWGVNGALSYNWRTFFVTTRAGIRAAVIEVRSLPPTSKTGGMQDKDHVPPNLVQPACPLHQVMWIKHTQPVTRKSFKQFLFFHPSPVRYTFNTTAATGYRTHVVV
jgi:hypothetical protein